MILPEVLFRVPHPPRWLSRLVSWLEACQHRRNKRRLAHRHGSVPVDVALAAAWKRYTDTWWCPRCEVSMDAAEVWILRYTETRWQPHHKVCNGAVQLGAREVV